MPVNPTIVCLDYQLAYQTQYSSYYAPGLTRAIEVLRRYLHRARQEAWRVIHCHDLRLPKELSQPIEAARPHPHDEVYARSQLSPFRDRHFSDAIEEPEGPLLLATPNLAGSGLATLFGCLERGLTIDLLSGASTTPVLAPYTCDDLGGVIDRIWLAAKMQDTKLPVSIGVQRQLG